MAITFDSASDGATASGGATFGWTHTTSGSDRILFVTTLSTNLGSDNVTGVTYNGVSMTKVDSAPPATGIDRAVTLWVLDNPASGANTVTVSMTGGNSDTYGSSSSYAGAKQTSTVDNKTTNHSDSTTSLTTSLTTVADNCWTIIGAWYSGTRPIAGTGSTIRTTNGIPALYDSNAAITPAGSYSMTLTTTPTAGVNAVMASFAPVPSTATGNFFAVM